MNQNSKKCPHGGGGACMAPHCMCEKMGFTEQDHRTIPGPIKFVIPPPAPPPRNRIHYANAHTVTCDECGHRSVVNIGEMGVSHVMSVSITCAPCLQKKGVNEEWAAAVPEQAEKVREFIKNQTKTPVIHTQGRLQFETLAEEDPSELDANEDSLP